MKHLIITKKENGMLMMIREDKLQWALWRLHLNIIYMEMVKL